jgi:hypothetical protein
MNQDGWKERLLEAADCFYQERNQQGMELFLAEAASLAGVKGYEEQIQALFDALEAEDYILAADLLSHEIVGRNEK